MVNDDQFYIGYLKNAPKRTARVIRRVTVFAFLIVLLVAVLLASFQRPFSDSAFEYGIKTTVGGHLFCHPVPHLTITLGQVDAVPLTQDMLLVGFGKRGAKTFIEEVESREGKSLEGVYVTLNGTLIYGDGKALLQVTTEENPDVQADFSNTTTYHELTTAPTVQLIGEVVDPKCYFGVMKPGEGKTHRSCAIRCIAGGIPAVIHATDGEYYILLDAANQQVNELILPFVGDALVFEGSVVQWKEWKFLKIDTGMINNLALRSAARSALLRLDNDITACGMY
jgi:hypothetical protein